MNGTRKYLTEQGYPGPKGHACCILTYKWMLALKYRILTLQHTDPKNLNNKEGSREDALISPRREIK